MPTRRARRHRCSPIHNLAFQGLFPHDDCGLLGLSSRYMSPSALEFHGQLSFMKAGLKFADRVTTVSPTLCARDRHAGVRRRPGRRDPRPRRRRVGHPQRHRHAGLGPGGRHRAGRSATAPTQPQGKAACKAALQAQFGLAVEPGAPLLGVVSRLTSQKGLDLVLSVLPELMRLGGQLVVQGTGEAALEAAFRMAASAHPGRVGVLLGYDEIGAHRLIAGADMILVPSRFEPCGLTQMYGLRYGTRADRAARRRAGRHGA